MRVPSSATRALAQSKTVFLQYLLDILALPQPLLGAVRLAALLTWASPREFTLLYVISDGVAKTISCSQVDAGLKESFCCPKVAV
jgi:hypothetical protein